MNIVSACCHKEVISTTLLDYPMGRHFPVSYKADVCEGCGQETTAIASCDCCGIPSDKLTETRLGDWCMNCLTEHAEDLIVREVTA